MKILLSFLQDNCAIAHPVPAYRFWSYYIKNGIEESEMQWVEVPGLDWAEGLLYDENSSEIKEWRARVWDSTLQFIKKNRGQFDIFLTYLYPKQIDIDAIKEIRKLGIPCVNFYCDNIRDFSRIPIEFKGFDLIWVPEYEALEMYKRANIEHIHLPMPMWVEKGLRQHVKPNESSAITFIGSKDILREKLLSDAINKGLPIEIWGPGWMELVEKLQPGKSVSNSNKLLNQINFIKSRGLTSFFIKYLQKMHSITPTPIDAKYLKITPNASEYASIIRNSKVTLGINRVPSFKRLNNKPLVYSRLRDIEAPMLGACYLTEYCQGLNFLFDIDNDIGVYRDLEELIYKADELLKDHSKRKRLRANGQQKALHDLSIPQSLKKLKTLLFK